MARKTFLERNGLSLCSDDRDIMVPRKYYYDVLSWCVEQGIVVENVMEYYDNGLSAMLFDVNLWRVKDDKQRLMFALRWS